MIGARVDVTNAPAETVVSGNAPGTDAVRGLDDLERVLDQGLDAAVALFAGARTVIAVLDGALAVASRSNDDGMPVRLALDAVGRFLSDLGPASPDDDPGRVHVPVGDGWTGIRAGVGDGRTAIVLTSGRDIPEGGAAATAMEAIALRVARSAAIVGEQRRRDRLDRLLVTAQRVAESLELDTVLAAIVRDATTLLEADSGDMLLWDRMRDKLRVVAVWNFPEEMLGFELDFGEGLSSQAIVTRRTLVVDDYGTYEHRARGLDHYQFGAVLCAPLVFRGEAIGAINVHARNTEHRFKAGDPDVLAALAGHAAIAIDHARRFENEVTLGRAVSEANRELTRSLTVQQKLAEQVLLDTGLGGIAGVLAGYLGRRVVIQDHLRRVVAGASPDGGDDWRTMLEADAPTGQRTGAAAAEPFAVAVRVGRSVAGHLLLSADDELGPIDRALVDVATSGVALEFAKMRAALEVEERLRGEVVADLLSGLYPSEEAVAARAARLGYDLAEPRDVLVIDARISERLPDASDSDDLRRLADVARERLALRWPRSLVAVHAGAIVVLAAPLDGAVDEPRELATELRGQMEAIAGERSISIAIGDRCARPDAFAPAFRLAREALDIMLKIGRTGGVIGARELGPYAVLLRSTSRDALEAFARRTLHSIVDYDARHHGNLLATLRAYLDENRSPRRTAARCFVHVNTVVYRIRRIEDLLALDLRQPAAVFDVTLALRILDLLDPATANGRRGSLA
jgi:sugar diacid utilization regulator/GAF domain-containing protein